MKQRTINKEVPRLMGAEELMTYLSMGKTKAVEFGRNVGAAKRIGNRLLFDRKIIDAAIDEL